MVSATEFKARCLALLDEVAQNGRSLVVTKRGRPVARVVPVEPPPSLIGSVTFRVNDDKLVAPTGERWDADVA
jgi:prevent-host-death family protein